MNLSLEAVGFVHANGHRACAGSTCASGRRTVALIGASRCRQDHPAAGAHRGPAPERGGCACSNADPVGGVAGCASAGCARASAWSIRPADSARQRVVTAVLAGRLGQWPLWKSLASLVLLAGRRRRASRLAHASIWPSRLFERCDRLSGGRSPAVGPGLGAVPAARSAAGRRTGVGDGPGAVRTHRGPAGMKKPPRRGVTLVASLHAVDPWPCGIFRGRWA